MIAAAPVIPAERQSEAVRDVVRMVATAPDLDGALRALRAGLVDLGFDRAAIWLIPPTDPTALQGTWGTDWQGLEVDEHGQRQSLNAMLSRQDLLEGRRVAGHEEPQSAMAEVVPFGAATDVASPPAVVAALRAGGQLFGVVTVGHRRGGRPLNEHDVALLDAVATRVAATLIRRQTVSALSESVIRDAVARLDRLNAELSTTRKLSAVIAQIGAAADIEQALDALLRGAIELADGHSGSVALGNWRTGEMGRDLHFTEDGAFHPADQEPGLLARLAESGEPQLMTDSWADEQRLPALAAALRSRGARSAISAPIEAGGERIGSLVIYHDAPAVFTATELTVAAALAAKAGLVIERIRQRDTERGEILARLAAQERLARRFVAAEAARSTSQAILDATGQAMILATPELQILTVNRRGEELFGVSQEEAQRWSPGDVHRLFAHAFGADADALLTSALNVDPERRFRLDLRQSAPQARDIELFTTPVHGGDGQTYGRLYVFRDVTRERDIDRLKSDFVSLVSHELRTPLTSVKGYLALVLGGEVGPLRLEQERFLRIAQTNTDRLATIVNDLLDLSRIDAGKMELRRAPVDLRLLLKQAAATLYPQMQARRQRLTLSIPPVLPRLLADGERLAQVFLNLLSNAHKYTPDDGTIVVEVTQDGAVLRVDIRDSGIGMTPEEMDRLFTRYYRAPNTATRSVAGAGLGLAITRSLVEMHGGEIRVTSRPGEGSTFSVLLPAALAIVA